MFSCPRCSVVSVLDTVVISGEDVCCNVLSSVVISVRVPESRLCVHISGED